MRFWLILIAVFSNSIVWSASKNFSWEQFVKSSLKNSPQVKQLRYEYDVPELDYLKELESLDWSATLETGKLRDRTESTANQTFRLEENSINSLTLKKYFISGTQASLEATTEDIRTRSTLFSGTQKLQSDSYLLTVEQKLWQDAFGFGVRSRLAAARKATEIKRMQRDEAIESALLSGSELFWKTATLERRYQESEAVLKRYETLVKSVERKNRNRYAAPGEYAQVQAQYYAREQQARINKINFEKSANELKLFLPDTENSELIWNSSPPRYFTEIKSTQTKLDDTRSVRLADFKKEQLRLQSEGVKSLNRSNLSLVGKVGATGIDPSATLAEKEWLEGRRPSLYVGVKWSHSFGSGSQEAQVKAAQSLAFAQDVATQVEKQNLALKSELLSKEIISLEENLKSQDFQLKSLRQAVQELTKNYSQGRIDINILIDLINQAETAEASQVEARASLELKYLEWQLLFDRINLN